MLLTRWRRSLQLRVVATAVLLSGAAVLLLGLILLTQIRDRVLQVKVDAAVSQADAGLRYSEAQLAVVDPINGEDIRTALERIQLALGDRGGAAGAFAVVIFEDGASDDTPIGESVEVGRSVPAGLRDDVRDGVQTYMISPVVDPAGGTVSSLLVGTPVRTPTARAELYFLFPLDGEQNSLSLIQNTILVAGLALVLLVGTIVGVVSRRVVTPVRSAARVSARLAAGDLEERMVVRGEDDLAVLATSFNDMAASLQAQITQLEQLSRLQQRFTSDVSHELRTPLTTVRMAADLLYTYREDFPAAVARAAELLQAEVDRFELLLADLLEISRFDAGAAVLEADPLDLGALVERVCRATLSIAARQGVELVVRQPGAAVIVEADGRRVERIVRNLVVNALEHGEGRPVDVTVAGNGTAAAIAVRDRGIGLRPGESEQVFSRFWRADPSRRRGLGGSGLGLSISLEDAHLHGGWLEAWGAPGQGALFRLTLPVRAGEELTGSALPLVPPELAAEGSATSLGVTVGGEAR